MKILRIIFPDKTQIDIYVNQLLYVKRTSEKVEFTLPGNTLYFGGGAANTIYNQYSKFLLSHHPYLEVFIT